MRNFSLLGLLIVVAIIGYMAKSMLAPAASHNPNDKSSVAYWVSHDSDRGVMLDYCNAHPDQQNSQDCKNAIAAQAQVDAHAIPKQAGQTGTDQASQQANDQLQAQQDANNLP